MRKIILHSFVLMVTVHSAHNKYINIHNSIEIMVLLSKIACKSHLMQQLSTFCDPCDVWERA